MDITYCFEQCTIGRAAAERFLDNNNSAIGAACDFQYFTESCFKTCPRKNAHKNSENKESCE